MLPFAAFLAEKLNETGDVVPVQYYFAHAPNLSFQNKIPGILHRIESGELQPRKVVGYLPNWIPTQKVVSAPKVMKKLHQGDDRHHPIIIIQDHDGKEYIIDGHHRAAAMSMAGINTVPVLMLPSAAAGI